MTEPTRDALHEETLAFLDTLNEITKTPHGMLAHRGRPIAYAAECVKRVPELEAEIERLRAKAAIVDAIDSGKIAVRRWAASGTIEIAKDVGGVAYAYYTGRSLVDTYAAATREGAE